MGLYWIISSILFHLSLKKNITSWNVLRKFIFIFLMQILLLPLLFFHHRQEVGLLFFSSSLAFFILGYRLFVKLKIVWVNRFLLFILLFVIFFIPHLTPLKHVIPFLDSALIDDYNSFLYSIGDLIVIGKVSDSRILDTLSFYGFIPFLIFIVYAFLSLFSLRFVKKYRIVYFSAFPGIVAFWILFRDTLAIFSARK